jgi:hypothetical protein
MHFDFNVVKFISKLFTSLKFFKKFPQYLCIWHAHAQTLNGGPSRHETVCDIKYFMGPYIILHEMNGLTGICLNYLDGELQRLYANKDVHLSNGHYLETGALQKKTRI